jgi:hypothetical protein
VATGESNQHQRGEESSHRAHSRADATHTGSMRPMLHNVLDPATSVARSRRPVLAVMCRDPVSAFDQYDGQDPARFQADFVIRPARRGLWFAELHSPGG